MQRRRLVVLIAPLIVAASASAKPVDCPDGRYTIQSVGRRARIQDAQPIDLALGTIALPSVCPRMEAERWPFDTPGRWFGRVRARWVACDGESPIRGVHARFDRTCTELNGVVRLRGGRKVRFRSQRVPRCGDGIMQAPEVCDATSDPCCTEGCEALPHCTGTPCVADADCADVCYCDWGAVCGVGHGECRLRIDGACGAGPVCGCDGRTYESYCAASASAVPIEYAGACGTHCQLGDERLVCAPGLFCDVGGWRCDQKEPGAWGTCVAVPADPATCVPYNAVPICGCDGKVYENDCYRLAARVQWQACPE